MKNLLLLVLFSCLSILLGVPAWAAPAKTYSAKYDVYAGGIHALQARLNYTQSGDRYTITLASETYGLLAKIIAWHSKFETKGWIKKDTLQPQEHVSDTTSKGKNEVNTYKYDKNGKFLGFTQIVNGKDEARTDLGDIMQGTTDVLSANFNAMRKVAAGHKCDHEEMIFDSERSYRLTFTEKGMDMLPGTKYSSFKGEAEACTVEVKPEGGKWHKKPRGWLKIQEQGRINGALPTLWYADPLKEKGVPAFPVRILIKTNYGTFIAHLTSFEENSGK